MANENYVAMTEGVKLFLENIGLEEHFSMFIAKGFDMESDIPNLTNADLDELRIKDGNHRNTILKSAATFKYSREFRVFEWLRGHGLDHYYINFLQADLTDLDDIARLDLPNPSVYDELEITMPGHKGRFERAVRQLRKRRRLPDDVEVPVCQGWWGRPQFLPHARYDFLCVEASIASPRDPSNSFLIEFMVDSGSDVTTVREEILEQLDLQVLGQVKSQGVHSFQRKLLYRALLTLGNQNLEIEVMGESYDSLGSRVLRNFRHFINGSMHLWLKGDYEDHHISPIPSPRLALTSSTASQSALEGGSSTLPIEWPSSNEDPLRLAASPPSTEELPHPVSEELPPLTQPTVSCSDSECDVSCDAGAASNKEETSNATCMVQGAENDVMQVDVTNTSGDDCVEEVTAVSTALNTDTLSGLSTNDIVGAHRHPCAGDVVASQEKDELDSATSSQAVQTRGFVNSLQMEPT